MLAIAGAQLLDCIRPDPVACGAVLIGDDGSILASGSASEVAVPDGVPTVDASGMTLLPGLIDGHVHLAWDKSLYTTSSREAYDARVKNRSAARDLVRAVHHAQLALAAGVTTLRDCGADDFAIPALRDAIDAGEVTGPRVLASGRPITTTRGHTYSGWGVDGADEIRGAVRSLAEKRVDFIKIIVSGGTTTPGTNVSRAQYSVEEVRAAVQEAHRVGLQVAGHAISTDSIRIAAEAGIDTIEHCSWIGSDSNAAVTDKVAVDFMVRNRVCVDHAIIPRPYLFPGEFAGPPTQEERWWLGMLRVRWPFLHHMRSRGVTVFLGTDAGFGRWPGTDLWPGFQEMARAIEIMVEHARFPPLDAIALATREAAKGIGLEGEIGTIAVGRRADLLLVAADPLRDIRALRHAAMVFRGGRLVAREGRLMPDAATLPFHDAAVRAARLSKENR